MIKNLEISTRDNYWREAEATADSKLAAIVLKLNWIENLEQPGLREISAMLTKCYLSGMNSEVVHHLNSKSALISK